MDFKLKDARPIWQQLASQLRERIVTGAYPPGSRFPSVRELAAEAGVNPNTMQRALSQLESDGLVVTNRTAGRNITEDNDVIERARQQLAAALAAEYAEDMGKLGYSPDEAAAFLLKGETE